MEPGDLAKIVVGPSASKYGLNDEHFSRYLIVHPVYCDAAYCNIMADISNKKQLAWFTYPP